MTEAVIKELATQIYEQEVNNRISIKAIDVYDTHVRICVEGYINMAFNIKRETIIKFSKTDDIKFKITRVSSGFYWIEEVQ